MNMRSMRLVFAMSMLLVAVLVPSSAFAQPSGTFVTGIACLNLEGVASTAEIQFYKADGTSTKITKDPFLAPWQIFSPNESGIPTGLSAGVVSSAKKVACSINTQTASGSAVTRVGSASGLGSDEIGTKIFATQIANKLGGTFDTYVAVQNATSSDTQVTAKYFDSTGAQVFSETKTIKGFASNVWYQSQAGLPSGFIGSATFESNNGAQLAGVVALYNSGDSNSTAQFLSFNTPNKGAAKVFLPRLAKNLSGVGYTSGWACQNLGPGDASMEMNVTFKDQGTGSTVTAKLTKTGVKVGQSWLGFLGSPTGSSLDNIQKGFGSGVVTATGGQIACTANEDNRTNFPGLGSTYNGVPDGKQTNKIFFAQIVALGSSSFRGGFQIANTTATDTTCKYTFTHTNGDVDVISNQALAGNSSNSVFAEAVLTKNKTSFNGSALVECGQPIVGIYNLSSSVPGDTFATNNGINQ